MPVQHESGTAVPTGPIGRVARLILAAVLIFAAYNMWTNRGAIFAAPKAGLLLPTGIAIVIAYQIGQLAGRGKSVLAALGVVAAAGAALAFLREGSVWAQPVPWLVVGFDLAFYLVIGVALLVAVVVGTPGCEIGVLTYLIPRAHRKGHHTGPVVCIACLHKLDEWEARGRQPAG